MRISCNLNKWFMLSFVLLLLSLTLIISQPSFSAEKSSGNPSFAEWLKAFRTEALAKGITESTLNSAFADLTPLPRILDADRNQPEFKRTLEEYLDNAINVARVSKGRALLRENWKLLAETSKNYPVQSRFLVALWGIETDFGRNQGDVPVIQALATLAYDSRRSDYFSKELISALQIVDRKIVPLDHMKGSWAGALGQIQFMPSVLLQNAVDFDEDGNKDIRNSRSDALASAANYLAKLGWKRGWTWGREVSLSSDFDPELNGLDLQLRLTDWQKLGVRQNDGRDLPEAAIRASLIRPDGPDGRSFLVYDNYRKLLAWNRSHKFAISVGLLADQIGIP